jgi:hypothetical protein
MGSMLACCSVYFVLWPADLNLFFTARVAVSVCGRIPMTKGEQARGI